MLTEKYITQVYGFKQTQEDLKDIDLSSEEKIFEQVGSMVSKFKVFYMRGKHTQVCVTRALEHFGLVRGGGNLLARGENGLYRVVNTFTGGEGA